MKKKQPPQRLVPVFAWAALIVLAIFAGYFLSPSFRAYAGNAYENISYALAPSPARAFAYGEQHFDPSDPANYDLERARHFFILASIQDPTLPYLYHQLARIYFLEGNFPTALADINLQISLHGDSEPAAYYVRGLIEGYMGDYTDSAADYQHFLQFEPDNWAAKNDEAWVLLKAGKYQDALNVANSGLQDASSNAWLLNSKATAQYELGDYTDALAAAQEAAFNGGKLTPDKWSTAYPGNDPAIATQGLASFQADLAQNIHTIQMAMASSTVQSN